jgi:large subunit ribosomal protein L30
MSTGRKTKAKPKARSKAKPHVARRHVAPVKKPAAKEQVPVLVSKPVAVAPAKAFLFAVRLKGSFGMPIQVEKTLTTLRLKRKFNGVLLENHPSVLATLRQAKDYVTWGDAKPGDITMLLRERGELVGGVKVTDKLVQDRFGISTVEGLVTSLAEGGITLKQLRHRGLKPVFRLRPPSGGFASSTKRPHGSRGELGQRGAEISELIAKMT